MSFSPTVNNSSGCHSNITAQMSFSPYSKLHAMVAIVTLNKGCMLLNQNNPTVNNPKPLLCKAENYASN
jgi:hypothetical protein